MEIPGINKRISQLVDYKSSGNRNMFAKAIGISQQTLNRLFNIDNRTKKYPTVTTEVLVSITEMFVDISCEWLLTGRGEMLKTDQNTDKKHEVESSNAETIDKVIDLATQLGMQINENKQLHHKNMELTAELEVLKKKKASPVPRVQSEDYGDSIEHIPGIAAEP